MKARESTTTTIGLWNNGGASGGGHGSNRKLGDSDSAPPSQSLSQPLSQPASLSPSPSAPSTSAPLASPAPSTSPPLLRRTVSAVGDGAPAGAFGELDLRCTCRGLLLVAAVLPRPRSLLMHNSQSYPLDASPDATDRVPSIRPQAALWKRRAEHPHQLPVAVRSTQSSPELMKWASEPSRTQD